MSWELRPVPAPIIDGVQDLATATGSVLSQITPLLDTVSAALDVARNFLISGQDPFVELANVFLDEAENLNNDIFGTGVFQMVINPFIKNPSVSNVVNRVVGGVDNPFLNGFRDVSQPSLPEGVKGLPQLSPSEFIRSLQSSLDDEGDINRPQFSSSSQVTAFGFLITAPSIEEFLPLIDEIQRVFDIKTFYDLKIRIEKQISEDITLRKGSLPNWQSYRLNSIEGLRQTQDEINRLISLGRGYVTGAEDVTFEFISTLQRKIQLLRDSVEGLNSLISKFAGLVAASGVYVLDIPPTVGGNEALRTGFDDIALRNLKTVYTAGVVYVGGGPSITAVNNIRKLFS